jgi:hypothetical protein
MISQTVLGECLVYVPGGLRDARRTPPLNLWCPSVNACVHGHAVYGHARARNVGALNYTLLFPLLIDSALASESTVIPEFACTQYTTKSVLVTLFPGKYNLYVPTSLEFTVAHFLILC